MRSTSVARGDILHIGLNKTATTWLQQSLFPLVGSHTLVGRKVPPDRAVVDAIADLRTDDYQRLRLRDEVAARRRRDRPVIVTNEALTSTLLYPDAATLTQTAERVHAELPQATVLLVVRRQAGLIRSSHRQYVKMGGTASLGRFAAEEQVDGYPPLAERYDLHAIYSRYRDLYGPAQVVVQPFEWLRDDPAAFLDELVRRLGLDLSPVNRRRALESMPRNVSLSWAGTRALRALNATVSSRPFHPNPALPEVSPRVTHRFARRVDSRLGPLVRGVTGRFERSDDQLLAKVEERYAVSNRALALDAGIDLATFGYAGFDRSGTSRRLVAAP